MFDAGRFDDLAPKIMSGNYDLDEINTVAFPDKATEIARLIQHSTRQFWSRSKKKTTPLAEVLWPKGQESKAGDKEQDTRESEQEGEGQEKATEESGEESEKESGEEEKSGEGEKSGDDEEEEEEPSTSPVAAPAPATPSTPSRSSQLRSGQKKAALTEDEPTTTAASPKSAQRHPQTPERRSTRSGIDVGVKRGTGHSAFAVHLF